MRFRIVRLRTCLTWLLLSAFAAAREAPHAPLTGFLDKHCIECHDSDTKKGDLDLTALPMKLEDPATFSTWVKVHDRVRAGEMPPDKKARPDPKEQDSAMASLASSLSAVDTARDHVCTAFMEAMMPLRLLNSQGDSSES